MRFPETLVLGATGRIAQLLQQVWPMLGGCDSILWQGRHMGLNQSLTWAVLDPLAQPELLARAARGRAVILCLAGVVPGRGSPDGDDLADNWRLAEAAIRAAAPARARLLLCSSAAVYGNQSGRLDEQAVLRPQNDYGRAKLEMERRAARLAAELGVELCCLRIGNIAGLDAALGGWQPGFTLDRFSTGSTPARSYIGVATLARVLADLLITPGLPGLLNVAQPGAVSMGALLDAAGLEWTARRASETAIAQVALDCTQLQQLMPLPPADAAQMVAQWQALKPTLAGGQE